MVTNDPSYASAAPIIQNLVWSTISDLIGKETGTFTYRSLNSLAPDCLVKVFLKCAYTIEWLLCSLEADLQIPP